MPDMETVPATPRIWARRRDFLTPEQIGSKNGQIYNQQATGELPVPVRRLIPIELELLNSSG